MNQSAKFQQRNLRTRMAGFFRATLAALAVVATWGAPTLASAQVSAPTGATSQLKPVAGQLVSFDIRKTTGAVQIPGSYLFSVTCTGLGGPYTGPNPVAVVLPSPGVSSVNVPAGALCIVKETPPAGSWNDPVFSGSREPAKSRAHHQHRRRGRGKCRYRAEPYAHGAQDPLPRERSREIQSPH